MNVEIGFGVLLFGMGLWALTIMIVCEIAREERDWFVLMPIACFVTSAYFFAVAL